MLGNCVDVDCEAAVTIEVCGRLVELLVVSANTDSELGLGKTMSSVTVDDCMVGAVTMVGGESDVEVMFAWGFQNPASVVKVEATAVVELSPNGCTLGLDAVLVVEESSNDELELSVTVLVMNSVTFHDHVRLRVSVDE